MEIEEGEYIRTKYGIAKIIRDCTDDKTYFDCFDIDRELDGCNFINDFEILKHSNDITDLIEEGDFGVIDIGAIVIKKFLSIHDITELKQKRYKLLEIVTKEQYERVKYKVGEE